MSARIVVVTGTGTDVGKTVATAAVAVAAGAAGLRVGVCKPAQTGIAPGEAGDLAVVAALAGDLPVREPMRYPEPLAPETAARRAGLPYLTIDQVLAAVGELAAEDVDLILVEGAGGVLVRLAPDLTVLDVARALDADVLVVTDPGLGALNHAELTVQALRHADCRIAGLVIGSWPADPDLAMRCNLDDLERLTGVPIVARVPAGAGTLAPDRFRAAAPGWVRAAAYAQAFPPNPVDPAVHGESPVPNDPTGPNDPKRQNAFAVPNEFASRPDRPVQTARAACPTEGESE